MFQEWPSIGKNGLRQRRMLPVFLKKLSPASTLYHRIACRISRNNSQIQEVTMENTKKDRTGMLLYGVMILLCTLIAMHVLAQDSSSEQVKPSTKRWQHLALTNVIGETPPSELASNINRVGREGWELVSVGNITESGTTTKTVFYFKRPL